MGTLSENMVNLTACAISMALRPWAGLEPLTPLPALAPLPPLVPLDPIEPIEPIEPTAPIGGGEIGGADMDVAVGGGGSPAVSFATPAQPPPS